MHLLLLIQKELHENVSQGSSFDFCFIYSLVEDLFHAKNEGDSTHQMKSYQLSQLSKSDHQVSFTVLAKKLDEMKIERTTMEEKAKKRNEGKVVINWKLRSGLIIQNAIKSTRILVISKEFLFSQVEMKVMGVNSWLN